MRAAARYFHNLNRLAANRAFLPFPAINLQKTDKITLAAGTIDIIAESRTAMRDCFFYHSAGGRKNIFDLC